MTFAVYVWCTHGGSPQHAAVKPKRIPITQDKATFISIEADGSEKDAKVADGVYHAGIGIRAVWEVRCRVCGSSIQLRDPSALVREWQKVCAESPDFERAFGELPDISEQEPIKRIIQRLRDR